MTLEDKEKIFEEEAIESSFPLFARKGNFLYEDELLLDKKYFLVGYEKKLSKGKFVYSKLYSEEPLKEVLGENPFIFID